MKNTLIFLLALTLYSCGDNKPDTTVTRDEDQLVVGQSAKVDNEAAKIALDANTYYIVLITGDTLFTNDPVWKQYQPPVDTTPVVNKPPVANAGADQTITLPINSVSLAGFGNDPEGSTLTYLWVKLNGTGGTITNPTSATTTVTGLSQGSYSFRLAATDEKGAKGVDDVNITVNGAPPAATAFQGFGSQTPGGTGKPIVHVTSLTPAAMSAAWGSNRIIVFDQPGVITGWRMPGGGVTNLTIDGTSNPVTFMGSVNNKGTIFAFDGSGFHDIIVKNIRVRGAVGAQDNDGDGINVVNGAYNIVFDHVSSSGNNDGNLDLTSGAHDITAQNCIFGGGLGYGQNSGWWSGTMLIAYSPVKNLSVHHNLFVPKTSGAPGERAPYVHSNGTSSTNTLMVDFRNNAVINWGPYGSGFGYNSAGHFINNYYKSTSNPNRAIDPNADPSGGSGSQFYISGNVSGDGASFPTGKKSSPFNIPTANQVTTQTACDAATFIKANAGCRPLDGVDQALINQLVIQNCSGTPPVDPPPVDPPPTTGYTLVYQNGYDKTADLDPFDRGQLGNGSLSTTIFKTGPGSFKSVPANVSSGIRSEVQYGDGQTPLEGIVEYDVYYDNFFANSGHSLQWHPSTSGGSGTGLFHKGGKMQFVTVKSGTSGTDVGASFAVSIKTWHHIKLTYKFGNSGYIKVELDGVEKVNANVQMGDGSKPYLKHGVNMWVNQTSVVYYDNLSVWKKN